MTAPSDAPPASAPTLAVLPPTIVVLTLALLAVATLAGCGVTPEDTPRPVDPPRAPFRSAPPAASPTGSGAVAERLFLVKDGLLVAVSRRVGREPTIDMLVTDLLNGPTDAERAAGLTSALLGTDVVASVQVQRGQAVVELAAPLEGTGRSDEVLAYAQLVCTLTARPEVNGVRFTRDDKPIAVPRGDGSLSADPLTAADYTHLIAQR